MPRHLIHAEVVTPVAHARVHTYSFPQRSFEPWRPQVHVLTLFTERLATSSRLQFGQPGHAPASRVGDLLFAPANMLVSGSGPGGPRRMVSCYFPRGSVQPLSRFEDRWEEHGLSGYSDLRAGKVISALRTLEQELIEPGFSHDLMVDGLLSVVTVELARYLAGFTSEPALAKGGLAPGKLRRIKDHVRAHIGGPLRAQDLAELVDVSSGHLMRAFRASTGETLRNFVERVRIEEARRLLATTDLPLSDISAWLGFTSQSSFSVAFRRACGSTPGAFRRQAS